MTDHYKAKISRRESLAWLGAMSAAAAVHSVYPAGPVTAEPLAPVPLSADWPDVGLPPVTANGYGQDPTVADPQPGPWPRTLTADQLTLVAVLADIIVPADGDVPSASQVGVPDVIDEWISAPYPEQQSDRTLIIPGLQWIDEEATRRFGTGFTDASAAQQRAIIDDIAFGPDDAPARLHQPIQFFDRLRRLTTGAFYTSPEGTADIGYLGNVPLEGDFPGPTKEAMAHLGGLLEELGLSL